ncbi:MAG: hypothetical protein WDO19_06635 [Bacteroidota bacterium]
MKEVKSAADNQANNTVSANGDLDFFHFTNFVESIRGNATLNSR